MTRLSRVPFNIGEYKYYDTCRFCLKKELRDFIDFGFVPLAGGFLKSKQQFAQEKRYPFSVCICHYCGLVQGRYVIDKSTLFEEYFYRSSAIATLANHFENYASELAAAFTHPESKFVVEIGSNDGIFLRPLKRLGFKVLGVDPAANIVKSLNQRQTPTLCAFFGEKSAKLIVQKYGQADLIVTSNSFAHIDDMHDVMRGVTSLLKKDGWLCIENHYLGTLINEFQFDMMYHEHMSYYSLCSLQNFFQMYGMEVFDVKPIPIHAGSMRYYVQFSDSGTRKKTSAVSRLLVKEKRAGLKTFRKLAAYSKQISAAKADLMTLLNRLKKEGKSVVGYGASGRATMMLSFCGISAEHLDFVVDDAPAKQGSFMPGSHLPIRASQVLSDPHQRPDYCLLFAWSFADEIIEKQRSFLESGGKFIVPLPKLKIISAGNYEK